MSTAGPKGRWRVYKIVNRVCPFCQTQELTRFCVRRGYYDFSIDRTDRFGNQSSKWLSLKGKGDQKPYVCEHGRLCSIRITDERRFRFYPRKNELDEAVAEMGGGKVGDGF
jgi:hypothetical protein